MAEPGRQNRSALVLLVLIVVAVWLLAGFRAYAAFSDAHNPAFAHVQATLSRCGQNGCEAMFSLHGRTYAVTGAGGRDGQRVTLYVKPDDPYVFAQSQPLLGAAWPLLLVAVLTVLGAAAWWWHRRRRQRSPAASRS